MSTPTPRLIFLRGNSGSGKTTVAARLQQVRPHGSLLRLGQDAVRRDMLRVRDTEGNAAVDWLRRLTLMGLEEGRSVVVEGILHSERYGHLLLELQAHHSGPTLAYRWDIPWEETLRRHATKPNAGDFGAEAMGEWWRDSDPVPGLGERVIGPLESLEATVARIVGDCGWDS